MTAFNMRVVVTPFSASRKFRAATQIAGQVVMSNAQDTETEAVLDLFYCMANRQGPYFTQVMMALDVVLAGFTSPQEMFAQLEAPAHTHDKD